MRKVDYYIFTTELLFKLFKRGGFGFLHFHEPNSASFGVVVLFFVYVS